MPYVFGGQFEQLPPWYKEILEESIKKGRSLREQEYPIYDYERVAPFPEYLKESHERAKKSVGQYEPYLREAAGMIRPSGLSYGQEIEPYMNPYLKHVLEGISREGGRTFQEKIMPALEAKFVGLGQHGSSRHRGMSERMARDLQNEILQRQQEALSRGYSEASALRGQEKLRNLETARTLGHMGEMAQRGGMEDINLLNSLGVQQQAQKQKELNEKQQEFWRRQMWPHQQLLQQAAMLHGMPSPSSGQMAMGYEAPQASPSLSPLGQIGGMAQQMYGMRQMGRGFKRGGHVVRPRLSKRLRG